MRAKIELDEAAISEAIAAHVDEESDITITPTDIQFHVEKKTNMSGDEFGQIITATAWVDL